ncbi:MAG TPA: nucleoside triphosphate pyrophosphohydrolase [Candidatus Saccharimonadales bacterium]|nr:nucleoside triphosphate pyrophosphohydrolase [Candidatus Saccharimonadales bacterium]
MPKFGFNKLVRDKIVDQQIKSGSRPRYRLLDKTEHKSCLVKKIIEEAREIVAAPADDLAGEIADVQQAIDDLKELLGLSDAAVAQAQALKNATSGPFKKGIYVESVEVSEDDP